MEEMQRQDALIRKLTGKEADGKSVKFALPLF